ncbi:MAG: 2-succinyl-5-enolpyruvyl-6-hydroxy-3-cyclohexene-1-carboxylic-acid synthase [Micrococcales bacterium]
MHSSKAQVLAANLMAQLVANGIDHIFVAPGARSQALAIAAGQLAQAGEVQLHVRLDERSMAFQALGVGLSSGFPAALITTSGTAVANLHPAVLEAHHAGVPMILLTADRPAELRGIGSNQTTNQVGIFADAVLDCIDVEAPAEGDSDQVLAGLGARLARQAVFESVGSGGPIQLNLAFREPLSDTLPSAAEIFDQLVSSDQAEAVHVHGPECDHAAEIALEESAAADSVIDLSLRTIVVAGDGGDLAKWYCTGVPLLAEPSSGVRGLAESVPGYLWILENEPELVTQVQQILVFGKPTLNRPLQALLKNPAIKVFSDPGRHGVFNPGHNTQLLGDDVEFLGDSNPQWLASWKEASNRYLSQNATALEPRSNGVTRPQLVQSVFQAADELNPLVLGASRMIRVAERWAPVKQLQVYANRGLAGIDGTVATASGIALTEPGATTRVLLGDLTLLHDSGSLVIDPIDANLNIQLVVGNDNGGTIFSGLEVAQLLPADQLQKLFTTPQAVNLEHLAKAYGWHYVAVDSVTQLDDALQLPGHVLIDVKLVD